MRAPMLTPPTISIGMPASYNEVCIQWLKKKDEIWYLVILANGSRIQTWIDLIMPTWAAPRAPPPPKTRPTDVPVSDLANREKSE